MNVLGNDVTKAMQVLASALVEEPVEKTSLCVDTDKEVIIFRYGNHQSVIVNCAWDSQHGAIRDFAKQCLLKL